jgi:hypothetical protein
VAILVAGLALPAVPALATLPATAALNGKFGENVINSLTPTWAAGVPGEQKSSHATSLTHQVIGARKVTDAVYPHHNKTLWQSQLLLMTFSFPNNELVLFIINCIIPEIQTAKILRFPPPHPAAYRGYCFFSERNTRDKPLESRS